MAANASLVLTFSENVQRGLGGSIVVASEGYLPPVTYHTSAPPRRRSGLALTRMAPSVQVRPDDTSQVIINGTTVTIDLDQILVSAMQYTVSAAVHLTRGVGPGQAGRPN